MTSALKRDSTNITISEFYERYGLDKYNFEPRYQRRGDVWDVEKQSFLMDTILKNYPMPPIFLHQRIDESNGATMYDVIDGKQRLTAIIKFLNNELPLPQDYDEGPFGNEKLNGLLFEDLRGDLAEFKKRFWRYVLTVEYIDTDDLDIIDNVFDRLNRNGEPLEAQELRKAKYHGTVLLEIVEELSTCLDWSKLEKIKFNRMQDQEFVSELLFYLLEDGATDASQKRYLDQSYEKWNAQLDASRRLELIDKFKNTINYVNELDIDFNEYKIKGVSHFYAIFAVCNSCLNYGTSAADISDSLNRFYSEVRGDNTTNENILAYRGSMQSNTKSKSQRNRRIAALANYCNVPMNIEVE